MDGSKRVRTRILALLGLLSVTCADPSPEPASRFERATMAEIAEAVAVAFPLSLSPERLADPAARARFHEALALLAADAGRLEAHGRSREASFAYLSRSLARDARDALRRLDAGHDAEAQFVVRQLVDDCVACHSRLPDARDSDLGARLVGSLDLDALPIDERARVEAATRQWDAALASYEQLFRTPGIPPAQLDLEGLLVDHLTVAIRVKEDLQRPRAPLTALARRDDVPDYLAADLDAWLRALDELARRPQVGDPLAEARALVHDAGLPESAEFDRRALIHALVASSLLHRFLTAEPSDPVDRAEAYWLLGLTETRIHHSLWLSEADIYLETAVRTAPHTEFAARAYELLEQETLAGYTGSSGLHLPEDVREHLDGLRELVDQPARAEPAATP